MERGNWHVQLPPKRSIIIDHRAYLDAEQNQLMSSAPSANASTSTSTNPPRSTSEAAAASGNGSASAGTSTGATTNSGSGQSQPRSTSEAAAASGNGRASAGTSTTGTINLEQNQPSTSTSTAASASTSTNAAVEALMSSFSAAMKEVDETKRAQNEKIFQAIAYVTNPNPNPIEPRNFQVYHPSDSKSKSGTLGTRTNLTTNYCSLTIQTESKKLELYEYAVKFEPELEGTLTQKLFLMGQFEDVIGKNWVFKSTSKPQKLFLDFKLNQPKTVLNGKHPRSLKMQHNMTLELVDKVQDNQQLTQFCDALFIRLYEILGLVELNQKLYDSHGLFHDVERRLEIWPGLLTYTRFYDGGLMLGFDTTIRALNTTSAYDVLQVLSQADDVQRRFAEYAIGKIFMTKFDYRMYKIADIAWKHSPLSELTSGGRQMSYVEYYEMNYGVVIQNMDQPLFVAHIKPKTQIETPTIKLLVPELCHPMRFVALKDDHGRILPYLSKLARLPPRKQVDLNEAYAKKVKENEECSSLLKAWNLELGDFIKVEGRVLEPPTLQFGRGIRDVQLSSIGKPVRPAYEGAPLNRWAVFCVDYDASKVEIMLAYYTTTCRRMGIQFEPPTVVGISSSENPPIGDFNLAIKDYVSNNKDVQLAMIVMPSCAHQTQLYSSLKKLCLLELGGLRSQMIRASTISDKKRMVEMIGSLATQINCKLGGAPWALNLPSKEAIMFVGIDTYHHPAKKVPSVFAMIVSLDPGCTKYYSRVSLQKPHQESGDNISPMFSKALASFHDENGKWPDRIIVFRDGINNRSMELIKEHELGQMRDATSFLHPNEPKFVFIVVQKRIVERLFWKKNDNDIAGNPQVGTVLDNTLTRLGYVDFFVVSQLKRDECVAPAHYVVIANDDRCPPDLLQKFAFVSCFMYYLYPGPIRIPGICQYAHRIASLVGCHLNKEPEQDAIHHQLYYL